MLLLEWAFLSMPFIRMNFDFFFKLISYFLLFTGLLALFFSGAIGSITVFVIVLFFGLAFFCENSKFHIPDRVAVILIFILLPLFYLDWKFQFTGIEFGEKGSVTTLSRIILALSLIKLFQKKKDRDWVIIYLISFFEVLLAAGLSFSPLYLVSLILFLVTAVTTIIAFEIKKSRDTVRENVLQTQSDNSTKNIKSLENSKQLLYRLPIVSVGILLLISIFAVPLFFLMPRVGGVGLGKGLTNGVTAFVGFSDQVNLGAIGKIQQNNEIVMRVSVENLPNSYTKQFRLRGVALDEFNHLSWKRSKENKPKPLAQSENRQYKFNTTDNIDKLTKQTVYLEPLDTQVVFAFPKLLAIEGFRQISLDPESGVQTNRDLSERAIYKVYSDLTIPSPEILQKDNSPYQPNFSRYLQLPEKLDPRIAELAQEIVSKSKANNRFDKAVAIEDYLKTNLSYTLDLKVKGDQPIADFLFNVKAGHCEYFATALAVLLRTQGVATRVVNGFQVGEFNDTANFYTISQREAHSWVEVYFPQTDKWVTFDATPSAGLITDNASKTGILGRINGYLDAIEMYWLQYVIGYDTNEQKTLAKSVKNRFSDYQNQFSVWGKSLQAKFNDWWDSVSGVKGAEIKLLAYKQTAITLAVVILGLIVFWYLIKYLRRFTFWKRVSAWIKREQSKSIIEFYQKMQTILESKGFSRQFHQTPLEFAHSLNIPEVVKITEKYHQVRFGEQNLTTDEANEIDDWLKKLAEP